MMTQATHNKRLCGSGSTILFIVAAT